MKQFIRDCAVITGPADGLAPLGARPSAGTEMAKYGSCLYTQNRHLKG